MKRRNRAASVGTVLGKKTDRQIARQREQAWKGRGDQPYMPVPTGKTIAEAEQAMGWPIGSMKARGVIETEGGPQMPREDIEAAIANAKAEFNYRMHGTLDAALESGARPMIVRGRDNGRLMLTGWHLHGNVVLV